MSIPSWAVRGARVVCIRDFGKARLFHDQGHRQDPELRQCYIIDAAEEWPEYQAVVLYLVGFPPVGFDITGFRPVITIEDDLKAHFAHHLDAPVRVSEEA